jgi:hypothetical protein
MSPGMRLVPTGRVFTVPSLAHIDLNSSAQVVGSMPEIGDTLPIYPRAESRSQIIRPMTT